MNAVSIQLEPDSFVLKDSSSNKLVVAEDITPKAKYEGDLIGTYRIRLPSSGFHEDIRVEFAPTHIKLYGGCNFHTIRYHAYSDSSFHATLETSTRRGCRVDEDSTYIEAIVGADWLRPNANGFILQGQQGDVGFLANTKSRTSVAERYLYHLNSSFRQFESCFVVRVEDPVYSRISSFLRDKYEHFLKKTRTIAAFRCHKVNHITYQVLFKGKTDKDVLMGVMNYYPSTEELTLGSLALLDLTILPISDDGCQTMGDSSCRRCKSGYGLFRGRCHKVQESCLLYDPEECFVCARGSTLANGRCT